MTPVLRRLTQLQVFVAIQGAILFFSAGTLRWSAGWWYIGLYIAMLSLASIIMLPNRAEVVAERSRGTKGGKTWDLLITRLMILPTLGLLVLAGLDHRWNLTAPLHLWLRLFGALAFVAGYAIVLWAMYANQYFSQVVRIQSERGHIAVTGGPYHYIRHPGYLGMSISLLGAVFLLDSLWGLICFVLYMVLIITRTAFEDRTLRVELPGYLDYAAHTRFRLIPGLW